MFKIKSLFDMIFTHRSGFVNVQKTKLFEIGITTSKFFFTNVTLHITTPSLVYTNWY